MRYRARLGSWWHGAASDVPSHPHTVRIVACVGALALLPAPGRSQTQDAPLPGTFAVPRSIKKSAAGGLVLAQVMAGEMTWQEAWEQKRLTQDDLVQLLTHPQWKGVADEQRGIVRLQIAALLAHSLRSAEGALEVPRSWSAEARLALADHYARQQDGRGVPLYEDLIEELDKKVAKSGPSFDKWVNPLAYLALFYTETGQPLLAARLWERAPRYSRNPEWLADALTEMAAAYAQAGEPDKALQIYAQVPRYGAERFTAKALDGSAEVWIEQGKLAQARQWLQEQLRQTDSEVMQLVLLHQLGRVSYLEEDFPKAQEHFLQAHAVYEDATLQKHSPSVATLIASIGHSIENALAKIQVWEAGPVVPDVYQVDIQIYSGDIRKPISHELLLRSFAALPLTVTCDDPRIKVSLQDWETEEFQSKRKVVFSVDSSLIKESFDTTLTIRCDKRPDIQLKLPIHVALLEPVEGEDQIG